MASTLSYLSSGMTIDEMLADWPELEREDIYEALGYAAWVMGAHRAPHRGGGVKLLLNMNVLPQPGTRAGMPRTSDCSAQRTQILSPSQGRLPK